MPLLNVKMIEGVFTPKQKQDMIRKLTDTMVSIEGENLRPYTLVVLEEVKSGDWGVAGNSLTDSDAKHWQPAAQEVEAQPGSAIPDVPWWLPSPSTGPGRCAWSEDYTERSKSKRNRANLCIIKKTWPS